MKDLAETMNILLDMKKEIAKFTLQELLADMNYMLSDKSEHPIRSFKHIFIDLLNEEIERRVRRRFG